MQSPLIDRLNKEFNYPFIDLNNFDSVMDSDDINVVFITGDPNRYPEALDVAVVLPELMKAFEGQLSPAVVTADSEEKLPHKFDFNSYPALVFIKQGICLGSICKIQDWQVYLEKIKNIIDSANHVHQIIPTINQESGDGRQ